MFDSQQPSTGSPAAIIGTIGGEVAVIFSAATSSFFDDFVLAHAIPLLPRGAARPLSAARRRARRAVAVRQRGPMIVRQRAARVRVCHARCAFRCGFLLPPTRGNAICKKVLALRRVLRVPARSVAARSSRSVLFAARPSQQYRGLWGSVAASDP